MNNPYKDALHRVRVHLAKHGCPAGCAGLTKRMVDVHELALAAGDYNAIQKFAGEYFETKRG